MTQVSISSALQSRAPSARGPGKLAGASGHLALQLQWVGKEVIKGAQPCAASKS